MQFIQTTPEQVVEHVSNRLTDILGTHGRVLWFVSGGSNISLTVAILNRIPPDLKPRLAIYLSDERYNEDVEYPESNLFKLAHAGLTPDGATVIPVLAPGLSMEEAVERYDNAVTVGLKEASYVFAYFGMGADGHIAGILPASSSVTSTKAVAGYEAADYRRITITPAIFNKIDEAIIVSFGEGKHEALANLHDKKLSVKKQPAQLMKKVPIATVYNDVIGDAA